MTIVIKGIKLLTKKGAEGLKKRLAQKKADKARKASFATAYRKRAKQRRLQQNRSPLKHNVHAGGQSTKGPVPMSKQSLVKSTLSGRTYSTRNPVRGRASEWRGHRGKGSGVAEFQSRVKDLIGLDSFSVRKAQERFLKLRNIKYRKRKK